MWLFYSCIKDKVFCQRPSRFYVAAELFYQLAVYLTPKSFYESTCILPIKFLGRGDTFSHLNEESVQKYQQCLDWFQQTSLGFFALHNTTWRTLDRHLKYLSNELPVQILHNRNDRIPLRSSYRGLAAAFWPTEASGQFFKAAQHRVHYSNLSWMSSEHPSLWSDHALWGMVILGISVKADKRCSMSQNWNFVGPSRIASSRVQPSPG